MKKSLKQYLVIVDYPTDSTGPPIAGIYVAADSAQEAREQIRTLLARTRLTVYRR